MSGTLTMPSEFGKVLRVLRGKAGLSQQQLAVAAGLSVSFVAKLERASSDPSWSTVQALAKALDVEVNAFADGANAGEEPEPVKPARKRRKG